MPNILNSLSTKNKFFLLAILTLVVITIPLTIIQVQKQQEIRQRASGENMSLYLASNENCNSPLTTLPLTSINLPLYLCLAAGTNKEGVSGFNITLSATNLTFSSAETTSQSQAGFDMQIANTTNTLNIKGFIKNIDNNVPVTTSLPLLKFNVDASQNSGNISITTAEITSLKQDAYLTVATSPVSFGTGGATAPSPTLTSKPCTAAGNWCAGSNPSAGNTSLGTCQEASGFSCSVSWDKCWNCTAKAPTPGPTSPFTPDRGGGGGGGGTGGSRDTTTTSGNVTLLLDVTLPGMSVTSVPITVTLYQGSLSQVFDNILLLRQTNSSKFTGNSESRIRDADIDTTKQYLIEVKTRSYKREIIKGAGSVDASGLRSLFRSPAVTQLPSVTLLPGDINNDGDIGFDDYDIIRACFGGKLSSQECATKKSSGTFEPDINRDSVVSGIDINLLWRGANGIDTD